MEERIIQYREALNDDSSGEATLAGPEHRVEALTGRLRDATSGLLRMLEFTRSRMVGVEMLQTYANQARILLQLYDEHQSMVENLLGQSAALRQGEEERGLPEEDVRKLLSHARQMSRHKMQGKALESCVICQSALQHGQSKPCDASPCSLQCGHTFHQQCIGTWLLRSRECPLCRSEQSVAAAAAASISAAVQASSNINQAAAMCQVANDGSSGEQSDSAKFDDEPATPMEKGLPSVEINANDEERQGEEGATGRASIGIDSSTSTITSTSTSSSVGHSVEEAAPILPAAGVAAGVAATPALSTADVTMAYASQHMRAPAVSRRRRQRSDTSTTPAASSSYGNRSSGNQGGAGCICAILQKPCNCGQEQEPACASTSAQQLLQQQQRQRPSSMQLRYRRRQADRRQVAHGAARGMPSLMLHDDISATVATVSTGPVAAACSSSELQSRGAAAVKRRRAATAVGSSRLSRLSHLSHLSRSGGSGSGGGSDVDGAAGHHLVQLQTVQQQQELQQQEQRRPTTTLGSLATRVDSIGLGQRDLVSRGRVASSYLQHNGAHSSVDNSRCGSARPTPQDNVADLMLGQHIPQQQRQQQQGGGGGGGSQVTFPPYARTQLLTTTTQMGQSVASGRVVRGRRRHTALEQLRQLQRQPPR